MNIFLAVGLRFVYSFQYYFYIYIGIGTQTWGLVTVGVKKNAPYADAAIREMSYTRHAFLL